MSSFSKNLVFLMRFFAVQISNCALICVDACLPFSPALVDWSHFYIWKRNWEWGEDGSDYNLPLLLLLLHSLAQAGWSDFVNSVCRQDSGHQPPQHIRTLPPPPTHHWPICSSVWTSWSLAWGGTKVGTLGSGKGVHARTLVNIGSTGCGGESRGRECVSLRLGLAGCHEDEHKGCWVAGRVAQHRRAASSLGKTGTTWQWKCARSSYAHHSGMNHFIVSKSQNGEARSHSFKASDTFAWGIAEATNQFLN